MNRRISALLAIVSCCLAPPLSAQGAAGGGKVTLRLLAFDTSLRIDEVFIHDPAAQPEASSTPSEIKGYLNHQSVTVPCSGRKLVFTRERERESMTKPGALIGEATLPAKTRSALLLFLPGKPGDQAASQIMAIDDSVSAFPAGSYFVTNLSPNPVRIELEKKPFEFKPADARLIKDPPVRANKHSGMRAFAYSDSQWRPIASGMWPHPGKARSLLVLYPNPRNGAVNLRAFGDVPPRKPAELAAEAGSN